MLAAVMEIVSVSMQCEEYTLEIGLPLQQRSEDIQQKSSLWSIGEAHAQNKRGSELGMEAPVRVACI